MNDNNVTIGEVVYTPNYLSDYGPRILVGVVIEINNHHQTALLEGLLEPFGSNFGAHFSKLYKTKAEAYNEYYKED